MLVDKFKKIFEGQNRAHGIFISSGEVSDKNKIKGSGKVIQEPITDALWQKHLKNPKPFPISRPITARVAHTVLFTA